MKTRFLTVAVGCLILGSLVSSALQSQESAEADAALPGRYMLSTTTLTHSSGSSEAVRDLCDTTTGEVWIRNGNGWMSLGSPKSRPSK